MDVNPLIVNIENSNLLEYGNLESSRFEFFPLIYEAAEAMIASEQAVRRSGLERLIELQVGRVSPLVGYLLATRLMEPDLELRVQIVKALAGILEVDDQGQLPATAVYTSVVHYLAGMRTRTIFALLQAAAFDSSIEPMVAKLLSHCSFAGTHLAEIITDRNAPLEIRKESVHFIGRIGYLDALPTLERQASRLESRRNGKNGFKGENQDGDNEATLLASIKEALETLRSP
jgi:hypothetical protein